MARRVRSIGGRLQRVAEGEEEDDEAGLGPLADGGRADGGDGHEDVHVDLTGTQRVEGGPCHVGATDDHGGGKEERDERRRERLGGEAGDHEHAGGERRDRTAVGEPEAALAPALVGQTVAELPGGGAQRCLGHARRRVGDREAREGEVDARRRRPRRGALGGSRAWRRSRRSPSPRRRRSACVASPARLRACRSRAGRCAAARRRSSRLRGRRSR